MNGIYPKEIEERTSNFMLVLGIAIFIATFIVGFELMNLYIIKPINDQAIENTLELSGLSIKDKVTGTDCYVGDHGDGLRGVCLDNTSTNKAFSIYAETHPEAKQFQMFWNDTK